MSSLVDTLRTELVTFMPDTLDPGVLYVSHEYGLTIHLCACGTCGQKTVTPLHPVHGWELTIDAESRATLTPSIGNFQMPCKSHYFVTAGKVVWC